MSISGGVLEMSRSRSPSRGVRYQKESFFMLRYAENLRLLSVRGQLNPPIIHETNLDKLFNLLEPDDAFFSGFLESENGTSDL